jgi:hypothetical protein
MYKFHFSFFFTLLSVMSFSQCKNADSNLKLDLARTDAENLKACLELNKMGMENIDITIVLYAYKTKNYTLGDTFLEKAIKTGATLEGDFLDYILPETFVKVRSKYAEWRSNFFKHYNEEMYNKIKYLTNAERYLSSENVYSDSEIQNSIRVKVVQNNMNELRLYLISNNKGKLPTYEQIGDLTKEVALLFLNHVRQDQADDVNYNFFEPLLKEEICSGKTYSPYTYIQFVDNGMLIIGKGEPQIYGHFRDFKTNKICLLKYPEKVDKLRASIGLQPLKEYVKMRGYTLPDNYIEQ